MKAGAQPRRGAPPKGELSARERILATANELFYREGVRAIRRVEDDPLSGV
jgi:AcrR family transcriptional regulator